MKQFFGKYRGKVRKYENPMKLGRLLVDVPSILGEDGGWAMPCVPYAGPQAGWFMLPPIDANVWVEFEGGDPNYPIWSGGFWGDGELPPEVKGERTKLIRTRTATILIDDDKTGKGGIVIEGQYSQKITMTDAGIELTDGQTSVKLSQGEVTIKDTLDVG